MTDMTWTAAADVLQNTRVPEGYELSRLAASEVALTVERLGRWYPALAVSAEARHLDASFFHEQTALAGQAEDRAILPLIIKHHSDGVVALVTYEKDPAAKSIKSLLGVLAPEHRTAALALLGPLLLEGLGNAIGAELAHYFATLQSKHQQVIAERRGYQLVGIVPGNDRQPSSDGQIRRVYDALYVKLLVESDRLESPPAAALTARTREVWSVLFGTPAPR